MQYLVDRFPFQRKGVQSSSECQGRKEGRKGKELTSVRPRGKKGERGGGVKSEEKEEQEQEQEEEEEEGKEVPDRNH